MRRRFSVAASLRGAYGPMNTTGLVLPPGLLGPRGVAPSPGLPNAVSLPPLSFILAGLFQRTDSPSSPLIIWLQKRVPSETHWGPRGLGAWLPVCADRA